MEGGGVRVGARERALQGSEQRETARGRSGRRGGAGALLGRGSGVVEGCRGAAGWLKRESTGHLGEGAGMEGHGNLGELCGLAVPWARRGGEETDRWGQAASEGAGRGLSGNASGLSGPRRAGPCACAGWSGGLRGLRWRAD